MAATQFVTQEGAVLRATRLQTALIASKLRLLAAPFIPTPYTTKAQLEANEIAYDGYPVGGYDIAAWSGPNTGLGGGAIITTPAIAVAYGPAEDPVVTGTASAWWIENATGGVEMVGTFDPNESLGAVGEGFVFVTQDVEGKNPPAPSE